MTTQQICDRLTVDEGWTWTGDWFDHKACWVNLRMEKIVEGRRPFRTDSVDDVLSLIPSHVEVTINTCDHGWRVVLFPPMAPSVASPEDGIYPLLSDALYAVVARSRGWL